MPLYMTLDKFHDFFFNPQLRIHPLIPESGDGGKQRERDRDRHGETSMQEKHLPGQGTELQPRHVL